MCKHAHSGSKLATDWRNITLQIPLSQDVLGIWVPQASIHMSHVEMEILIAQQDIEQEEASSDYTCQL